MRTILRWLRHNSELHTADPRNVIASGSWEEFVEHCLTHDPIR